MSTFKQSPELYKQIDYRIITNGWIQFYASLGELGNDQIELDKAGYSTVEFNCRELSNLIEQFSEHFHFPSYFRNNLDGFSDCIRDIEINGIGLVIVLKNLQNLKKDDNECLLNILTNQARLNFIIGKRLLILAHHADSNFTIQLIQIKQITA